MTPPWHTMSLGKDFFCILKRVNKRFLFHQNAVSQRVHVWNVCLHLGDFYGTCRQIPYMDSMGMIEYNAIQLTESRCLLLVPLDS